MCIKIVWRRGRC
uniref:Alpha protein n=1 Tax=Triatoma infestans TaxID=30076 RepID=A0A171B2Q3_TRIIF